MSIPLLLLASALWFHGSVTLVIFVGSNKKSWTMLLVIITQRNTYKIRKNKNGNWQNITKILGNEFIEKIDKFANLDCSWISVLTQNHFENHSSRLFVKFLVAWCTFWVLWYFDDDAFFPAWLLHKKEAQESTVKIFTSMTKTRFCNQCMSMICNCTRLSGSVLSFTSTFDF